MLRTEVTQTLYEEVVGSNPSFFKGKNYPVERVNWYDALRFCNELSRKMGLTPVYSGNGNVNTAADGFRLPTLAEWNYAAQGGEDFVYAGSNNIDEIAWYSGNSNNETHPVAQKKPNGYGLYDMNGNVYEWCQDTNFIFTSILGDCHFVGFGCFSDGAESNKLPNSIPYSTKARDNCVGFRIVRNVDRIMK